MKFTNLVFPWYAKLKVIDSDQFSRKSWVGQLHFGTNVTLSPCIVDQLFIPQRYNLHTERFRVQASEKLEQFELRFILKCLDSMYYGKNNFLSEMNPIDVFLEPEDKAIDIAREYTIHNAFDTLFSSQAIRLNDVIARRIQETSYPEGEYGEKMREAHLRFRQYLEKNKWDPNLLENSPIEYGSFKK